MKILYYPIWDWQVGNFALLKTRKYIFRGITKILPWHFISAERKKTTYRGRVPFQNKIYAWCLDIILHKICAKTEIFGWMLFS